MKDHIIQIYGCVASIRRDIQGFQTRPNHCTAVGWKVVLFSSPIAQTQSGGFAFGSVVKEAKGVDLYMCADPRRAT